MTDHIHAALFEHEFFREMAPQQLDFLASVATGHKFEAREIIFREGEPAEEFHLLRDGKVAVQVFTPDRGPVTIQTVGGGAILGWSWLVEPRTWNFDAQAIEPTRAIGFDAVRIRDKCDADPVFGYALLRRFVPLIVNRLQATRMQMLDLYHVHS